MGSRCLAAWAASIAVSIAGPTAFAASDKNWTLVDLGTLGGPMTNARALSDTGYVVGCAQLADGTQHAFIYRDGVMRDLAASTPAGTQSCAYAVNNDGVAAGLVGSEVVVWRASGMTRLGIEGWVGGINDAGTVVGSFKFGASSRAFLWNGGAIVNLGTLGGSDTDPYTSSEATAINSRGQIAGASNGRAFLYENGALRDLGSGRAFAINDRGEVVGMTSNHGPVPFIYSGVMTFLPGPGYSSAVAINNAGQVAGSGEGIYGYLLEGGSYTRLDVLPGVAAKGWRHLEPSAINSRGWIAGSGVDPQGNPRGYLLMPSMMRFAAARERVGAQSSTNPVAR
jgi:probable HAF family extracellular repeat protein